MDHARKITDYYSVIFDFECDAFKRKIHHQLYLYKQSCLISAKRRYGPTKRHEAKMTSMRISRPDAIRDCSIPRRLPPKAKMGQTDFCGKSCLWITQNRKQNTQIYERLHARLNGTTGHDFSVIGKSDKPNENHARKV
jgi:hypothetical protein